MSFTQSRKSICCEVDGILVIVTKRGARYRVLKPSITFDLLVNPAMIEKLKQRLVAALRKAEWQPTSARYKRAAHLSAIILESLHLDETTQERDVKRLPLRTISKRDTTCIRHHQNGFQQSI